jgi:hypothetical protein
MLFPEIKIKSKIIHNNNSSFLCSLCWKNIDNHKKENINNWYKRFLLPELKDSETKVFHKILEEILENIEFYPIEYKELFDITNEFILYEDYYNEMIHQQTIAISEWNRRRLFDTSVRETILEVSEKSVWTYFYLLSDNLSSVNKISLIESIKIRILYLFRFWIEQTGNGLIVSRCWEKVSNIEFYPNISGMELSDMNLLKNKLEEKAIKEIIPRDERIIKQMIKEKMRDDKISDILKK